MNRLGPCSRRMLMALAFIVLAFLPMPASAEPSWFGNTSVFRGLMGPQYLNMEPLAGFGDLQTDPGRSLLIVFGDTTPLESWGAENLQQFLEQGGAVLLATDQRTGNVVRQVLGVSISGARLHAANPPDMYLGRSPECPILKPADGYPDLFQNTQHIVANVPSAVDDGVQRVPEGRPKIILRLPDTVQVDNPGRLRSAKNGYFGLLYPHCQSEHDQVLLLADQDIFIDGMMCQPQNDNFFFAWNCLNWLANNKQRTRALFYDRGQIVTDFDVPFVTIPTPELPNPVAIADSLLNGLEKENAFNKLLLSIFPHRVILCMTAMLVMLGLLAWWIHHVIVRRAHAEDLVPLVVNDGKPAPQADPLLMQRQRDMLERGNLWEAAHHLARDCFDGYLGDQCPRPSVAGSWWQNYRLRRRIRKLWRLAQREKPRPISQREFRRLSAWAGEIRQALTNNPLDVSLSQSYSASVPSE